MTEPAFFRRRALVRFNFIRKRGYISEMLKSRTATATVTEDDLHLRTLKKSSTSLRLKPPKSFFHSKSKYITKST